MRKLVDSIRVGNNIFGIGSTYITEEVSKLLNTKQDTIDLDNKLDYELIANVPEKLSDFTNDLNFLTEHQSLSAYSTTEEVENKINNATSGLAKSTDIPTKVSELDNDKGYLTKHQSLTEYAKKVDIPTKVSQLANDRNYTTMADVEAKGYLTEHQSLSGYATEEWVESKGYLTEHQSLENYSTKEDLNTEISTRSDADDALSERLNQVETTAKAQTKDITSIKSFIPEAATDTNKLADKDWVNSSIASNTATFRGTFETVADLPVADIKKNDYAFIIAEDASGDPEYQRYKYDGESWVFEYTLNNSSFTSDQWKAINSGITSDTLGTLINATTLSDELAKYLPLTGGTLTGTLNVPSISGVGSITLDEAGIINTTGTHIKVTANFPLFPNIAVAQTNIARPILLQSPLDGAMNKSDSNFTYNGNTHILSVSNINTNSESTAVAINTGTNANSYFQSQKFRGEGNASEYRHAIDFGYSGHDQVDFYEYGGKYNFWQNQSATKPTNESNIIASLQRGKLVEQGNTLTYPGKSGTIALTSDIPTVPTKLSEFTDDVVSGNYLPIDGTAVKATADASGNVITNTYATKTELREVITDAEKVEEATAGILCGINERLDVLETSITAISDDEINTICV